MSLNNWCLASVTGSKVAVTTATASILAMVVPLLTAIFSGRGFKIHTGTVWSVGVTN